MTCFVVLSAGLNSILLAENQGEKNFEYINLPENLKKEQIILKVEGKIQRANPALFDLETIKKFPSVSFNFK